MVTCLIHFCIQVNIFKASFPVKDESICGRKNGLHKE